MQAARFQVVRRLTAWARARAVARPAPGQRAVRAPAQNVVEYGVIVATVVLLIGAGASAMAQAEKQYFGGLQKFVDPPRILITPSVSANPTKVQTNSFEFSAGSYAVNSLKFRHIPAGTTSTPTSPLWDTCTTKLCTASVSGLADGIHVFEVDAAVEVANYTWIVDTLPPTTSATLPPTPASGWYTTPVTIALSGTDTGSWVSTVYYALNNSSCTPSALANCTAVKGSSASLTVSADGTHRLYFFSVDAAGNLESQKSVTFKVDATPPDTAITGAPSTPSGKDVTFTFSSEAGATFECQLDSGGWEASCASPKAYTGLSDGSHTFRVRAVDAAGNQDPTPATHAWTVDATAPTVTITTPPPDPSGDTVSVFFTSSEAGCSSYRLDGGAWSTPCSPLSGPAPISESVGLVVPTSGEHTLEIRVVDSVGNEGVATVTWTVDATPPTVSSRVPDVDATGVAADSAVTATFSEEMNAATITGTNFTLLKQG